MKYSKSCGNITECCTVYIQKPFPLFQCHSVQDQSGLISIPNIPDFLFINNAAASDVTSGALTVTQFGLTYIFTIPAESEQRNCSGTVLSIQYCYEASNETIGSNQHIFNLLVLQQNGLDFTIEQARQVWNIPTREYALQIKSRFAVTSHHCQPITKYRFLHLVTRLLLKMSTEMSFRWCLLLQLGSFRSSSSNTHLETAAPWEAPSQFPKPTEAAMAQF